MKLSSRSLAIKKGSARVRQIPAANTFSLAFRVGITCTLIGIFLRGSYLAYEKVEEGRIGSSVSFRPAKVVTYPDVAVCIGLIIDVSSLEHLPQLYDMVRLKTRNLIREMHYKMLSKTANLRNISELNSLGYQESDVWSEYLGYSRGYISYCKNFHPPINSTMGTGNDLDFLVDFTGSIGHTFVRLTHEGNHFPSNNRVFGKVSIVPQISGQAIYELGMEEKSYLSRDERECRDNYEEKAAEDSGDLISGYTVYECFMNYVEDQMGCRLPWHLDSPRPNCTTRQQLDTFLNNSQAILSMGNADFIALTGCTPMCKINIYEALHIADTIPTNPAHLQPVRNYTWLQLELFFSASEIRMESEVLLYDVLSAIGEVGGYLGMLLGYSLLSFYDIVEALMQKFIISRKIKEQG